MALHRVMDAGNVLRTITRCRAVDPSGIVRTIKRRKVVDTDGTTIRTVATYSPAMTVSASPSSASGIVSSGSPATVITDTVTMIPTGGTGPYTYAWTNLVNGGGTASSASPANSASAVFVKPAVDPGVAIDDTLRGTVTDALGQTATVDVLASFLNTGDFS